MTIFQYILIVIAILIMTGASIFVIAFIVADICVRFRGSDDDDDEDNFDV